MSRLGVVVGIVAALAAGCAVKKGRGLVLVDLTSDVKMLKTARVVVVHGSDGVVGEGEANWDGANPSPLKLGVYVSEDITGTVDVYACGFAEGTGVAKVEGPKMAIVEAGGSSAVVTLTLVAGAPAAVCGAGSGPGTGGGGGTTPAGTGGSGGYAGGVAGAGGSTGGASAGRGGGAVAGSGGTPIAGSGGTAGAGGRAGGGGASAGKGGGAAGIGGGLAGGGAAGKGGGAAGAAGAASPHWYGQVAAAADPLLGETFPKVAVDAAGNAVTVFRHLDQIWFNYYSAATNTWGTPGPLDPRGSLQQPSVAVDKNGVWLAIWDSIASAAAQKGIYQSTSTDGTHWSAPAPITTAAAYGPVLAMNDGGTAVVAWTEVVGGSSYQAMAAARAATGASWSSSIVLRPGTDNGDREPAVAVSGTGEAFVLWTQNDASWGSIWVRPWVATTGWGTAELFETYNEQRADMPALAANKAGVVIGTYVQTSATTMQLLSRRYTPGSGFGPPLKVAEANEIDWSLPPTVTLDDAGNATAAWAFLLQDKYQVYTNRQGPNDAAWPASPMMMENDNAAADDDPNDSSVGITHPQVRAAPTGAVTLMWRKRTGTRFDLVARRFEGGSWGSATLLETRNDYPIAWPALAVGAGGTAVAVWHYITEVDIWANVYR